MRIDGPSSPMSVPTSSRTSVGQIEPCSSVSSLSVESDTNGVRRVLKKPLDVDKLLLRTHTSNVQIRSMETFKPPVKVLSCGRVFRRDEITMRRSPMFHQAEGFLVDRGIHIGHLRATLEHFIHRVFGPDLQMRMRPSFFPFTEPSAEVDMSCVFCKGAGCGTCSHTGWMEILGCGMIHPQVLRNVGIDPEEWSGFAFGLGLDRVAMIKFGIPNIRTLFENDLRVLQQF